MTRSALALALLILIAGSAPAWRWPLEDPAVLQTFGHNDNGGFQRGMLLAGGTQPVYPVSRGRIVFVYSETDSPPVGLGNYVVVQHEQGFRSVYAHLESATAAQPGTIVDEATPIGVVGETGILMGRGLEFYLLDTENQVYVNPLLLLPPLPDNRSPSVANVYAESGDRLYLLSDRTELPNGEYNLLLECSDRFEVSSDVAHAPYSIELFQNGQRQFALTFDMIGFDGGDVVRRSDLGRHAEIYAGENFYRAGTLTITGGRTDIVIVVGDFGGNESSYAISITEPGGSGAGP